MHFMIWIIKMNHNAFNDINHNDESKCTLWYELQWWILIQSMKWIIMINHDVLNDMNHNDESQSTQWYES